MRVELIASTNNLKNVKEAIHFSQNCARVCYTKKDFDEIQEESINKDLQTRLIDSGHHSVFEHINFTFNFKGIPKALAMVLNNEKQYATSEKSARYTQMSDMVPEQKEKYDKWMSIFISEIDKIYPQIDDSQKRDITIKKLAQENARYMTSVFTPTKMVHTINLRQLNFLFHEFEKFEEEYKNSNKIFMKNLSKSMKEFATQTTKFKIKGLENQTDRHLSLFNSEKIKEYFGDVYSTCYLLSFAGLAQAHRHRTLNYQIAKGTELGAPSGFFIPEIISDNPKLKEEWSKNLKEISENDFPQAQLLIVKEKGMIEDFRSKALLRMCGHAQYEIMQNTLKTAELYLQYQSEYKDALNPKCLQGFKCLSPCVWGGKKALERIV